MTYINSVVSDTQYIINCYERNLLICRKFEKKIFSNVIPDPDINIVIGFKGRNSHLITTLKYLNHAILQTDLKINVFLVEHDTNPYFMDLAKINNLNYGFLDIEKTSKQQQYSRALVFNSAIKQCPKPKWWLFHDVDLIVPHDFFIKLKKHMDLCKTWIQPFAQKRVIFLNAKETEKIQLNHDYIYNVYENFPKSYGNTIVGAPGGSTLIPHNLILDVGGYDDELFYGYAPEDAFLWVKLECIFRRVDAINYCHMGSALYAEDVPQFHQDHPRMHNSNPFFEKMEKIMRIFYSLPYEEKLKIIEFKKNIFKEQKLC